MIVLVEFAFDFICPWSRITERHLHNVINALPAGVEAEVSWLPFEINPSMPLNGRDRAAYLRARPENGHHAMPPSVRGRTSADEDETVFNYGLITRIPSTRAAHRLVLLAREPDVKASIVDKVFRAYFQEGKDISSLSLLAGLGREAGMDGGSVEAFLTNGFGEADVIAAEARVRCANVISTPAVRIAATNFYGYVSYEALYRTIVSGRGTYTE